uniref:TIR domain-containing protein n=1 Tax=Brassica oleracea var. oleracea TaxID=109376 RepID=A0A0D3AW60_BRAOL
MDSSLFRTIIVAAIGFSALYILDQETREDDTFSSSSSSLSLSSSSLSLSRNWTHDVFPSFHGEDVRKDFLSHIQKGFERKGIIQFSDNEMERGESISFQLVKAIRGSKIAVVLFSRNYASSKWCPDELVEIMKCRREFGQIVIAVFYKVDPSDIRKQTGNFGNVFRKTCAGKTNEEIRRWRVALAEVAAIAGYHSSNWRSIDFNYDLVGMGSHLEEMRRLLYLDSDEIGATRCNDERKSMVWSWKSGCRLAVQDRDVLEAHRIGYVYRVALPSDYEAMQIFCMAAFGQKFPKDGYEDLARRICNIAGRLPLRLKIMGSYFRGMSKQEWVDKIDPL